MQRVRVRGIYATALTARLRDRFDIVSPSAPIAARFEGEFAAGVPDVEVDDTPDRLGVGLTGTPAAVDDVGESISATARDTLSWKDPAPPAATFEATVTETLGRGAVVDLGPRAGYLPYTAVEGRVEAGDTLRVQVRKPAPPWTDRRPEVATGLEATGGPITLVRGGEGPRASVDDPDRANELVRSVEVLDTDVPDGWSIRFEAAAAEATLDQLDESLRLAADRTGGILGALDGGESPLATVWAWFGRETRFALDDLRRTAVPTMPGHHRLKAVAPEVGTAVDLVEVLCEQPGRGEFPFDVVAAEVGPDVGDELALSHGKPDGRRFALGVGEVTAREGGTVTVRRKMSAGGAYDGLDVTREEGDIAVTRLTEGRWWYPTVYRNANGAVKGTYVNVCTPVELFPDAATYVDLEVDVVKAPDGTVERVDDDELAAAVEAGHVPSALAEKAREVAASVERGLRE